jgi:uncharacterized protein with HEPN domain/predicted nucleotidyltransferase
MTHVNRVVEEKLPDLIGICRHNGIRHLELFGSCARNDFDPATSDLDFLAVFEDSGRPGISQSYFNARHEFEQLFGRKVDLLTLDALTNPFLIDAVDRDRVVLCETVDGVVIAKEPRMYLHDAATALAAISRYLTGKSLDDYQRDDLLQAAVERRFEIAAEALNQVSKTPPSITSRIPDLAVVVGFRNVLARDYAAVNNRIVWDLVQTRAPALLGEIEKLLRELSLTADPEKSGGES